MNSGHGAESVVYVVDDEDGMRQALRRLFKDGGIEVDSYASAQQFLAAYCDGPRHEKRACLVLDLHMPAMSGLELQAVLRERGISLPIVFLTGASRVADAVAAMKAGAQDFLEKPYDPRQLLERVKSVLDRCGGVGQPPGRADFERKRELLTAREREVMELMLTGQTSKEIARVLGCSYRTVEIHRARVMQKMETASFADLVRQAVSSPPVQ
jgi:two-component system, LuxR family, response regulator FixJ